MPSTNFIIKDEEDQRGPVSKIAMSFPLKTKLFLHHSDDL